MEKERKKERKKREKQSMIWDMCFLDELADSFVLLDRDRKERERESGRESEREREREKEQEREKRREREEERDFLQPFTRLQYLHACSVHKHRSIHPPTDRGSFRECSCSLQR